jgi:cell division inhibitor SepF
MPSVWKRAAVYLGLVDDDEYDEYDPYDEPAAAQGGYGPGPAMRRGPAMPSQAEPELTGAIRTLPRESEGGVGLQPRPAVVRPITPVQSAKVFVVAPTGFPDAKEIGDKLKASQPVIVNLQGVEPDLCRRIIDFASGLAYGLGGTMEKVAQQVFLLTPTNVSVSDEEKRRLQERGLYRS